MFVNRKVGRTSLISFAVYRRGPVARVLLAVQASDTVAFETRRRLCSFSEELFTVLTAERSLVFPAQETCIAVELRDKMAASSRSTVEFVFTRSC